MRKVALGLLLAGFVGAASAGDYADARYADGDDYSAKLFYRFDFGGAPGHAQSVGLRFDNEVAAAHGAPALFLASFSGGAPTVALQGLPLVSPMATGLQMSDITVAQWVGIAFTGLVFASIAVNASDENDQPVTGTGS